MIAREAAPAEVYGDSAYGTGDLRAALTGAGHQLVIKPGPLKPAVEGGFTTDDFTVDETAGTVTCPAGMTRRITARRAVIFGAACRACPLRGRCTTAREGRTLHLHQHDALLRGARADWSTQLCARTTASTAPTSSVSSPRSPAAAGGASNSATGAQPAATPGSSAGPPASTCATSSAGA
jgi:hypothetical protein